MLIAAKNIKTAYTPEEKEVAQAAIVNLLSESRGIPMKIGQFLANTNEKQYLSSLTKTINPMPLSKIGVHLAEQFGGDLSVSF